MSRTVAVLLALSLVTGACTRGEDTEAEVRAVVEGYLSAWAAGDYAGAGGLTDDPAGAQALLEQVATDLDLPAPSAEAGEVLIEEDGAQVAVQVTWPLPQPWSYQVTLDLVLDEERWLVDFTPAAVHPQLQPRQALSVTRTLPERASILDAAGTPLFTETPIVVVGVDPANVTNADALAGTLGEVLGVDAAQVSADIAAGTPGQFVPVITLRRTEYDAVRDQIFDLPGTVFQEGTRQLAPTAAFARGVLGRVGPVTAEIVEESDGLFVAGDEAGLSGLQRAYQDQLTGTPGYTVSITAATAEGAAVPVSELESVPGVPGEPVATTLDTAVQTAADLAVATIEAPSYVVAVRPSTGELLAVAANAAAVPGNALSGQYPPGSTFKIVTAAAVLDSGAATAEIVLPCPASTTVDGREFENEDRFFLGDVPFQTAFSRSCNSTFTALGVELPEDGLRQTAAGFGLGSEWDLPIGVYGGDVPVSPDPVDRAADSIGQGQVLVSPFAMAYVAAAVATGATPVPVLAPAEPPAGTAPAAPPPAVLEALRPMLREVVTEGTAAALAGLPGEVAGKTGTAEFGTGDPPPAHAWFAGYRGDLAFAVLVEGGQSSSTTAVPMAAAFLTELGG